MSSTFMLQRQTTTVSQLRTPLDRALELAPGLAFLTGVLLWHRFWIAGSYAVLGGVITAFIGFVAWRSWMGGKRLQASQAGQSGDTRLWASVLALCSAGVLAGHGEVLRNPVQVWPASWDNSVTLSGWISEVRQNPGGRWRVQISGVEMACETSVRVDRIQLSLREPPPKLGIRVSARVQLSPPGGPVVPGGYDLAQASWYRGVSATGFAFGTLEEASDQRVLNAVHQLTRWRGAISSSLYNANPTPAGGVLAALVSGDRAYIDPETTQILRDSGLGHILAISGLHLALVAGGSFALLSFVFLRAGRLAHRIDPRRPAALAAIAVAFGYLVLSGAAIATQRAFIVALVFLLAVVFYRRALTFRSLAIAVVAVLAWSPSAALDVGFQMSFAAALALTAVFERGRVFKRRASDRGLTGGFFTSLLGSSLVAGAATGVVAAYHFNRWAVWGLPANLLAMPVFSFLAMPAAILSALLLPFGLAPTLVPIAAWPMEWVLTIARWASERPDAVNFVPQGPPVALLLGVAFLILTAIGGKRLTIAGVVCLAGFWATTFLARPPVFWLGDDGAVIVRDAETRTLWVSGTRRYAFASDTVARSMHAAIWDRELISGSPERQCDDTGCIWTLPASVPDGERQRLREDQHTIASAQQRLRYLAFPRTSEALAQDCKHATLIIWPYRAPRGLAPDCENKLISAQHLSETQGGYVEFENRSFILSPTRPAVHRPWRPADAKTVPAQPRCRSLTARRLESPVSVNSANNNG